MLGGDQKCGSKAVLEASHNLEHLPYRIEWSSFRNAAPLLEALNAGPIDTGIGGDAAFIFSIGTGAALKAIGAHDRQQNDAGQSARRPTRRNEDISGSDDRE